MGALIPITAPAAEPITLAEAKAHLRVTITSDDALITSLITAARQHVETSIRRALITQTWDFYLDRFPDWEIEMPLPPLAAVISVKYMESSTGALTTLATSEYLVSTANQPGRVTPAFGKSWPSTYGVMNAVVVRFDAGYGGAGAVPQGIKQAIYLLLGAWYEHRESIITGTIVSDLPQPVAVGSLLAPYKVDYF